MDFSHHGLSVHFAHVVAATLLAHFKPCPEQEWLLGGPENRIQLVTRETPKVKFMFLGKESA